MLNIQISGAKWHKRRKMLTPAFHFKILEEFVPVFNDNIQIFISKLRGLVNKKDGVDIVPLVTYCALDIICGK
jgi:cytochrome P450